MRNSYTTKGHHINWRIAGTGKIAEEELDGEEMELIKFQHGVALTPITYGPCYGGMVGDFEKPIITSFFKVVSKGKGNCIKPSGRYLYFYEEVDNDEVASGLVPALAKRSRSVRVDCYQVLRPPRGGGQRRGKFG